MKEARGSRDVLFGSHSIRKHDRKVDHVSLSEYIYVLYNTPTYVATVESLLTLVPHRLVPLDYTARSHLSQADG